MFLLMAGFRKSKKVGPIRVTASKRGISTSVGGKAFRVTKGADGRIRTTIRIPKTGISRTTTHGKRGPTMKTQAAGIPWASVGRVVWLLFLGWVLFAILGLAALVTNLVPAWSDYSPRLWRRAKQWAWPRGGSSDSGGDDPGGSLS